MEGAHRPGHFNGVAQVVTRLLQIVQPHHLFMGQKDYQQYKIIDKMLQITQSPVVLHMCPTLREPSGLAMSSRNIRLSPKEREQAAHIYRALFSYFWIGKNGVAVIGFFHIKGHNACHPTVAMNNIGRPAKFFHRFKHSFAEKHHALCIIGIKIAIVVALYVFPLVKIFII